jgi:hypothetical protein
VTRGVRGDVRHLEFTAATVDTQVARWQAAGWTAVPNGSRGQRWRYVMRCEVK